MFIVLPRIKSLERDNAQKRILAEDMKMKMKMVQENVKSDAAVMVCSHGATWLLFGYTTVVTSTTDT